jgi:hypothetical protein
MYADGLPRPRRCKRASRGRATWGSLADLRFHCPPVTVVLHVALVACGPSAAPDRVPRLSRRDGYLQLSLDQLFTMAIPAGP